jgi:O-antigen/teichoic acid export membrane protein
VIATVTTPLLTRLTAKFRREGVARDFARVLTLNVAGRAGLGVAMLLVVKWLTKAQWAEFAVAYGFMMLFNNLWAGFYSGITRRLSELLGQGREGQVEGLFWKAFRIQAYALGVLTAAVLFGAESVAELLYGHAEFAEGLRFGALAGLAAALTRALTVYYQVRLRFGRYAVALNLRYVVLVVGVLVLGAGGWFELKTALGLLVLAGAVSTAWALADVRRLGEGRPREAVDTGALRIVVDEAPVIAYYLMMWAAFEIPMMLAGHVIGDVEAIGSFALAWRIFHISFMVLTAIHHVLLPRLARGDMPGYQGRVFGQWLRWMTGPAVAIGAVAWWLTPVAIPWLVGARYADAVVPIQLFGVLVAYNFIAYPLFMLLPQKDYRWLVGCGAFHVVAMLGAGWLGATHWGAVGLVGAVMLAYASYAIGMGRSYWNIRREATDG